MFLYMKPHTSIFCYTVAASTLGFGLTASAQTTAFDINSAPEVSSFGSVIGTPIDLNGDAVNDAVSINLGGTFSGINYNPLGLTTTSATGDLLRLTARRSATHTPGVDLRVNLTQDPIDGSPGINETFGYNYAVDGFLADAPIFLDIPLGDFIDNFGFDGGGFFVPGSDPAIEGILRFDESFTEVSFQNQFSGTAPTNLDIVSLEFVPAFTTRLNVPSDAVPAIIADDTQVNVLSGGSIAGPTSTLLGANRIEVNVYPGGTVGDLTGNQNAVVNVFGGTLGILEADAGSQFNINGGQIEQVIADTGGTTHITGGSIDLSTTSSPLNVRNGGTMRVEGGATVTSTATTGNRRLIVFGADSALTVTGSGTSYTGPRMDIGPFVTGTSTANVEDNALVDISGPVLIGSTGDARGELIVDGGTVNAGQTVVRSNGLFELRSDGVFNTNSTVTIDGDLVKERDAQFNLAAGQSLIVQNSGNATFFSDYTVQSGRTLSLLNGGGFMGLADFCCSTGFNVDGGTVLIDGLGSGLSYSQPSVFSGNEWTNNASVTIRNQGSMGLEGSVTLDGNFAIQSDAHASVYNFRIDSGSVSVDDGTLDVAGNLLLQGGTLDTSNGGIVTVGDAAASFNGGSSGQIAVSDNDTNGSDGGSLFISGGHQLTHAGSMTIGGLPGEAGWAEIRGGSFVSLSGPLTVGLFENGSMTISQASTVTNQNSTIAEFNSGGGSAQVTVTGAGSSWLSGNLDMSPGDVPFGGGGEGVLLIEDGGYVLSNNASIATEPGSGGDATVTVTGADSRWVSTGSVNVGSNFDTAGRVNVLPGGTMTVADTLTIELFGLVGLNGGTLNADTINDNNNGQFNFSDGTLSVRVYNGDLVQNGGDLAPGDSPESTTVSGDYNLNNGSIAIEIGGVLAGVNHDEVNVINALNLGATSALDVILINAFSPSAGDSFDIFDFGSVTGSFNAINLPGLGAGLGWDTSGLLIDGTLAVVATSLIGDLDGDGFVGINDLNIVLGNWNLNVPPANPLADPSGDGFVGIDDLNTVLGNWNAGTPPTASNAIPEPASLMILALSGAVLTIRSRRSM